MAASICVVSTSFCPELCACSCAYCTTRCSMAVSTGCTSSASSGNVSNVRLRKSSSCFLRTTMSPPQARMTSTTSWSCSSAYSRCSRVTYSWRRFTASVRANSNDFCNCLAIMRSCVLCPASCVPASSHTGRRTQDTGLFSFHRNQQRELVLPRQCGRLGHFHLRHLEGVDPGDADALHVNVEHDAKCL